MKMLTESKEREFKSMTNVDKIVKIVCDPDVDYEGDTGELDHMINHFCPESVHVIHRPEDEIKLLDYLLQIGIGAKMDQLIRVIGICSYNYIMDLLRSRRDQLAANFKEDTGGGSLCHPF